MSRHGVFAAILAIAGAGAAAPVAAANYCGPSSSTFKELSVPEYLCFSFEGGTLPYAACAAGRLVGYKPVYFGAACRGHDQCYGRRGVKKSSCDNSFRSLLIDTCDMTLTGRFRKVSRANCRNVAAEYHYQVKRRGCSAYTRAQKRAGNANAVCD